MINYHILERKKRGNFHNFCPVNGIYKGYCCEFGHTSLHMECDLKLHVLNKTEEISKCEPYTLN